MESLCKQSVVVTSTINYIVQVHILFRRRHHNRCFTFCSQFVCDVPK